MINLLITGNLTMEVVNFHTGEKVDKETEQGVSDNLQQGEYIIAIHNQTIVDINNTDYPLYKFILSGEQAEFDYED